MQVIIKEMEIPERCFVCDFFDESYCKAQKEFMPFAVFGNYKDKDCPLIEVINCKDYINFLNNHLCLHWSKYGTIETKPDDFCSYGERK